MNKTENYNNVNVLKCKAQILEVTNYEYLGSLISNGGEIETKIANRAGKVTNIQGDSF